MCPQRTLAAAAAAVVAVAAAVAALVVAPVAVLLAIVWTLCRRYTSVVVVVVVAAVVVVVAVVGLAAVALVAPVAELAAPVVPVGLAAAVGLAVVVVLVAVPALVAVALVVQPLAQLDVAAVAIYSAVDPCADADAAIGDSSGRKPCRTCHIRAILCDNYRPYVVSDAAIVRASGQNRDHSRDTGEASALVLNRPVAMSGLHRACETHRAYSSDRSSANT